MSYEHIDCLNDALNTVGGFTLEARSKRLAVKILKQVISSNSLNLDLSSDVILRSRLYQYIRKHKGPTHKTISYVKSSAFVVTLYRADTVAVIDSLPKFSTTNEGYELIKN